MDAGYGLGKRFNHARPWGLEKQVADWGRRITHVRSQGTEGLSLRAQGNLAPLMSGRPDLGQSAIKGASDPKPRAPVSRVQWCVSWTPATLLRIRDYGITPEGEDEAVPTGAFWQEDDFYGMSHMSCILA